MCALYPIGRGYNFHEKKFFYFENSVSCGDKAQTHTLKEWLDSFDIIENEDVCSILFCLMGALAEHVLKLKKKENIEFFQHLCLQCAYLNYVIERPYKEQLLENIERLRKGAPGIKINI